MPRQPSPLTPLSADEFDRLADLLEAHSPFDTDGLLGVLNAVAIAPSFVPPSTWLPVVLPTGLAELDGAQAEELIGLLFRQHADVIDALEQQQAIMPAPEEIAECKSFAAGYAAGAELDPEWLGNADHWSFAAPMAYLGQRLDLVSRQTAEDIQNNFAPDPEQILRQSMAGLLDASLTAFRAVRERKARSQASPGLPSSGKRAGRNAPCPCGSGKKHKRCCIGTKADSLAS